MATVKPKPHKARKRFGQNFLIDTQVIDRIVATIAPKKTDNMLEIGPGKGAITLALLETLNQLHVVEIDHNLVTLLESLNQDKLSIHQADILQFNPAQLPTPLRIIGNLPYNISSPILFHLLVNHDKLVDMTLMLQKEVVERIVANPGNKHYGRLSVMMQAFFEVEFMFIVGADAFQPAPKVDSAVVYMKPLKKSLVDNAPLFEKMVKTAFSKRRKTLNNCLKSLIKQAQTSINLSQRAEQLSVADFIVLTQDYEKQHRY